MAPSSPKYLSLRTIVHDWASSSGVPPLLIVRRIGEWALMDGFESDAFIHENGAVISRIDIYAFCVAVAESTPFFNGRSNTHVAAGALVSTSSILVFCRSYDVRLPKSAAGSGAIFSSMIQSDAKHDAPPPCPEALERAKHLNAEEWAIGSLDTLTTMLRGEATGFMGTAPTPAMTDFNDMALSRWSRYADMAQGFINQCAKPELQAKLNALIIGWDEASRQAKIDAQNATTSEAAAVSVRKDVVLGRPKGSPLAQLDDISVDEIRQIFLKGGRSVTAIARTFGKKLAGDGDPESRAKRVAKAYFKKYPRPI